MHSSTSAPELFNVSTNFSPVVDMPTPGWSCQMTHRVLHCQMYDLIIETHAMFLGMPLLLEKIISTCTFGKQSSILVLHQFLLSLVVLLSFCTFVRLSPC